jgi:Rad3-related DNA helicase
MTIYDEQQVAPLPPLVGYFLRGDRQLRLPQTKMGMLVQQAISEEVPVVIEAPTGIGKTMAYLIPAILSGKVVVVSTANKALQEQIYYKDVPFLQEHVQRFGATMLKGVGNYLCLDRLYELRKDLRIFDQFRDFEPLLDVVQNNGNFLGDFETLPFPIPPDLRVRVNGDSDQCAWSRCDWFDECYIRSVRDRAKNSQVIIVNHTLLLLDAAADNAILPPYDVLILDEAHHLNEEATAAFTIAIRPTHILSLLQLRRVKAYTPEKLYNEVVFLAGQLWSRLEKTPFGSASKVPFKQPVQEGLLLSAKLTDLADALRQQRPANQTEKEEALYDKVITRAQNLAHNVHLVFAGETAGEFVHFIERLPTMNSHVPGLQVSTAPLNVAPFLKEKLFDKKKTVIMTSATLATIGPNPARPQENGRPNFAYFRKHIGLDPVQRPEVIESILPHTFDYQRNALLYVPRDIPEPAYGQGQQAQYYTKAIADRMRRLVFASRGRAFLLFSSRHMLEAVYERIAPGLPYTLLRQGDMNRSELIKQFRAEGAVLMGLKTFWEGVDIAGEALSLVAIAKLPFGVPDDPIHAARVDQMKAKGEDWFGGYVLPQVVLALKQGVGRLLRTRDDFGAMAILDARLHTKGYGASILSALPNATRTMKLGDVEKFFKHEEGEKKTPADDYTRDGEKGYLL